MKRISIFAVMVTLVLLGTAAANALAAPEWLENGGAITAALGAQIRIPKPGSLLIEDIALGAEVKCTAGSFTGTVGPGKIGTVTEPHFNVANCASNLGKVEEFVPIKLPWESEIKLIMVGANLYQNVLTSKMGKPGLLVKAGGFVDTCEWEAAKPGFAELTNIASEEFVDTQFGALAAEETPQLTCSLGKGKGLLEGLLETVLLNGSKISVSG
jgi:hypothetical protein